MDFTLYNDEFDYQDVITIEYLRQFYSCCSTCGVNWQDGHVTLDCDECGDYGLKRPCLECNGKCNSLWRRNLALTHENQRASWEGECLIKNNNSTSMKNSCILASKANKNSKSTTINSAASFIQTGLKVS